jgi:hypothetical protein
MLRAGRFRHRLLEDSFLQVHAKDIHGALLPFLTLWKAKNIFDHEMAAIYIFIFSFFRRPDDFLGGPHRQFSYQKSTQGLSCHEVKKLLQSSLPQGLRDKKILGRLDSDDFFIDVFCDVSWRSIPLAVPRSLRAWQNKLYSLNLMTSVPTPEEVLNLQCQGQRCVSMLTELSQIQNFVEEGRDVLGFIVHDLIHADHFFFDQEGARAQILFSQKLQHVYALPQIQKLLSEDATFRGEFYYLMSDMNSVPLHLLKTLKAVLLGHFKRHENQDFTSPLPATKERLFIDLFEIALQPWDLDACSWQAALRLNTPQSRGQEDALLLDRALNKLS